MSKEKKEPTAKLIFEVTKNGDMTINYAIPLKDKENMDKYIEMLAALIFKVGSGEMTTTMIDAIVKQSADEQAQEVIAKILNYYKENVQADNTKPVVRPLDVFRAIAR